MIMKFKRYGSTLVSDAKALLRAPLFRGILWHGGERLKLLSPHDYLNNFRDQLNHTTVCSPNKQH